ncbi:MAG: hypothetical protein JWO37_928 [Acidimicrobiales bacterium]|jgi:Flp pilus assembly protein TadD|nr:hypothetical protein [Acidimicrobiales bacterium]
MTPPSGGKPRPRKAGQPPRRPAAKRGGRPDRIARPERPERAQPRADENRKGWGGVARRGAGQVRREDEPGRPVSRTDRDRGPRAARQDEVWIREEPPVRDVAKKAVQRGADATAEIGAPTRSRKAPPRVRKELVDVLPPARAGRAEQRLMEAAKAFERERYQDAARSLRPLAQDAPGAATVRELYGLALYRLGRWTDAARELEAFRKLTGSVEQHPVLADCHRALRHWKSVDKLWNELREASPSASLVTEGRIVAAGARADQGDVAGAIRLLEGRADARAKRPDWHQLRLWYALADLYERAGDVPKARDLFSRVAKAEPDFADVAERLQAI